MVVYADLVFLLNFLIDAVLLKTTAWAGKSKVPNWRIGAASLIGAAYAVMLFVPPLSFMFTLAVKCLFSLIMIWTAFGFRSLQHFIRLLGIFYAVNFMAAGGILGLHYIFQSSHEILNGIFVSRTGGASFSIKMALWFVLPVFFGMIVFYRVVQHMQNQRNRVGEWFADVQVRVDDFCMECRGLIDTGNQLYEPLSRTPVMVMELEPWRDVLPEEWSRSLETENLDHMMKMLESQEWAWRDRLRLVPYKGVQKNHQFMMAIKPDKVVIRHHNEIVEPAKVLIGFNGGRLSTDGSYQAIIHPALLPHAG